MVLSINTNMASLVAQRHLQATTLRLQGNFRRLASGRRIATSADDPAGFAISQRLVTQIKGLKQASRNASDGISLAQIGEGALGSIGDVLTRARELAVQAANGTLNASDKDALQAELAGIQAQVDQIASSASFNGLDLLNGTIPAIVLQVGWGALDTLAVSLSSALSSALGIDSLNIGSAGDPGAAITTLDKAIDRVSLSRARYGALQNTLNASISSLENQIENLSAANSRIMDVDIASEMADLARNTILQQAGLAVLAQANAQPRLLLRLLSPD